MIPNIPLQLAGKKFGRLTGVAFTGRRNYGGRVWQFVCDCGQTIETSGRSVSQGITKSCGCLNVELSTQRLEALREKRLQANTKHGHARRDQQAAEYGNWLAMRKRCNNPNAPDFHWYGGIGIRVCARWNDFQSFLDDMGPKPTAQHSIDRVDPYGNYEPSNCRWATPKEQRANQRIAP